MIKILWYDTGIKWKAIKEGYNVDLMALAGSCVFEVMLERPMFTCDKTRFLG